MAERLRLDVLLVMRGLVESREKAQALILAGKVTVDGKADLKAGSPVPPTAHLHVAEADHPWVGRGGVKLAHALDVFAIDVTGRMALDIGASTGGFTDVLLQRGARHVVALDVGHNQLHWRLRTDPRVTVREGINARALSRADVPELEDGAAIVTIDVAFISIRLILPVVPALLAGNADIVALVKPQFEAGREDVGRGGLVTDPAVHARVVDEVTHSASQVGLLRVGLIESPITGAEGNREFLMHLRARGRTAEPRGASKASDSNEPRSGESHEARSAES